MGLGSSSLGAAPFGFDSPVFTDARDVTPPPALAFDGTTRDFQLDSAGRFIAEHPVDAKVFAALRTVAGSIRSAPTVGQTINSIAYIDQQRIRSQVEDRVRAALAPMTNAGEIRIENIEIDTSIRGRIALQVDYVNLILGARRKASNS
jgi:hypothetical protein